MARNLGREFATMEAALLDDEAHARGVEAERKSRRGTGGR
jgi:hypothetical protein